MRVALDARWIFDKRSGIGIHTRELIRQFRDLMGADELLLLFEEEALRDRTQQETGHKFASLILPYGLFSLKNQRQLGAVLRAEGVDVYHSTNYMLPLFGRMPASVITVHDLIPLVVADHAPKSKKSKVPGLFRWILKRAIRRADAVIAVSESTRQDLVSELRAPREQVQVVYNGVDAVFVPGTPGQDVSPYLLYVGRFDPYKNVPRLIEAFARLRAEHPNLELRIIGSPDERYPEAPELVIRLGLADCVHFLGGVGPDEIVRVYQGASALVLASDYEGFGLPVAEAMACGVPVVCGNRSSLPEIAGEAALTVDPQSTDELVAALQRVLGEADLRAQLIAAGLEQVKRFTWRAAAEQTLAIYRDVAR